MDREVKRNTTAIANINCIFIFFNVPRRDAQIGRLYNNIIKNGKPVSSRILHSPCPFFPNFSLCRDEKFSENKQKRNNEKYLILFLIDI